MRSDQYGIPRQTRVRERHVEDRRGTPEGTVFGANATACCGDECGDEAQTVETDLEVILWWYGCDVRLLCILLLFAGSRRPISILHGVAYSCTRPVLLHFSTRTANLTQPFLTSCLHTSSSAFCSHRQPNLLSRSLSIYLSLTHCTVIRIYPSPHVCCCITPKIPHTLLSHTHSFSFIFTSSSSTPASGSALMSRGAAFERSRDWEACLDRL